VTHEELRRDAVVVPVALALVRAAVVRGDRGPGCLLGRDRRQFARQAGELADELGDDRPGEGYLTKAGRLTAARYQAEEIIRHEYGPLPSDDEDDGDEEAHGDEDDGPIPAGERPMVVDRDHPSWAEVDAEQRERIHDPATETHPRSRDRLAMPLIRQANAPPNLSGRRGVA
jgi:hypothetical protein